jgi:hypothetical protein
MIDVKKFLKEKMTKEASLVGPASMTVLSMPGTAAKADQAYAKAMQKIHAGEDSMKTASMGGGFGEAAASMLGGGNIGKILSVLAGTAAAPFAQIPGQMMAHKLQQPSLQDLFKTEMVKATGKELGSGAVNLFGKALGGAADAIGGMGDGSARNTIIAQLKKEDPVIAKADTKLLMEAFDTMVQFAPTLSKDKNAVRSYLREAVLTGSGPNYATIKMLADAERAVTGGGGSNR